MSLTLFECLRWLDLTFSSFTFDTFTKSPYILICLLMYYLEVFLYTQSVH